MIRFLIGIFCLGFITSANAGDGPLKSSPTAKLFGSHPDIRDVRLSPDASKLSFLKTHPDGFTIATVMNLVDGEMIAIVASKKDENELEWCRWANETRLLCAFSFQVKVRGNYVTYTRMMGVNADGSDDKVLLEDQLEGQFSQIQTNIIDWMGDDPNHVLIQTPKGMGSGVGIMDVYTGRYSTKERNKDSVYAWISDGHGNPRLYNRITMTTSTWSLVEPGKLTEEVLRESELKDLDNIFLPQGFGENTDELLYFDWHEGRMALFGMNLTGDRSSRLIYAHPRVDVAALHRLGKYDRLVGIIYAEEALHQYYFDEEIRQFYDQIKTAYPNNSIIIIDEDWNRRNYLVEISSDTEPGTYYIFDRQENKLKRIGPIYSSFKDKKLSEMSTISYPARDGKEITAYLSLPASGQKTGLPAVILPHGGPSSRDVWGFDFLVQYLTAEGYAVLQSNYRGSSGYGKDWEGDGAFRNWRTAIDDITDGAKYLVDQGIADPNRICTVGWSYGGYAALMSGIEEPDRYRCIVSIAGVTDPQKLGWSMKRFVGGVSAQAFIGTDDEVTQKGSPVNRAGEIQDPVLLVHAEKDVNVPFKQSEFMLEALKQNSKSVEFITYKNAEHSIIPERYRIDLLTRLGEFLDQNTK